MQRNPQVLAKFRDGAHCLFDINGYPEYMKIMKELRRWWLHSWMLIGKNAVIKKSDIDRLIYYPEGYNVESTANEVPPT